MRVSGGWRRAEGARSGHASHAMAVPLRCHARLWSCQQPVVTFEEDAISQLLGGDPLSRRPRCHGLPGLALDFPKGYC